MKVVYVIGPFRGKTTWDVVLNCRNAELLGLEVAKLGAMPLIPHNNTKNFNGLLEEEFWVEGTKEILRRSDAAITVAAIGFRWEQSQGSIGEVQEMDRLVRPVFHALPDLEAWLKSF